MAAIFRWVTACAGTIGGPAWKGIGLHVLHSQPMRTALGCHERYRSGGHGEAYVYLGPPKTDSHTAFVYRPIQLVCYVEFSSFSLFSHEKKSTTQLTNIHL